MRTYFSGYDTETVRQMWEEATASKATQMTIINLSRPGSLLHKAQVRPGFFKKGPTKKIVDKALRRRLAAQLGRKSPRLLDDSHNLTCITCRGKAVKWEGRWLCENGHGGNING